MENKDSWQEWSRYVLAEMKRLNSSLSESDGKIEILRDDVTKLKISLAMLQVKSGIWGLIGGIIPIVIFIIVEMYKT